MASVNKEYLSKLYLDDKLSTTDIAKKIGVSKSTVRLMLIKNDITLRSPHEGIKCSKYKWGIHNKGKKIIFTDEWKKNISKGKLKHGDIHAKGLSIKPNGYVEITRGKNKGRSQHIINMEERIGRNLLEDEVVHHIDGNRSNNDINNLALMTRSGHCRHHALGNHSKRDRNKNGQFK